MKKLYIHPDTFFLLENDSVLVWHYAKHDQYLLNAEYFAELMHISAHGESRHEAILEDLLAAEIVITEKKEETWGWDILSKIYHVGTKNVLTPFSNEADSFIENYLAECAKLEKNMPDLYLNRTGKKISLPSPELSSLENVSLWSVLKNRKTSRNFHGDAVSLGELSTILYGTFGLIHGDWQELTEHQLKQTGMRKASPASGGIHVAEAYLCIYQVEDLLPGIYHYSPKEHQLTLIDEGDFSSSIVDINYQQDFSQGLAFGIYITARFDRSWWKYPHSRAYRMLQLDIGHVSQTCLLICTALGLQTWLTGAFVEEKVEKLLQIDGLKEAVVLFLGVGKGELSGIPASWLAHLA